MRLMMPALLAALALSACDDGDGGQATTDATAREDGGGQLLDLGAGGSDRGIEDATVDGADLGDAGETPDQGAASPCQPALGYGPTRAPAALADEARHSVKVVWSGNRWGATWRSPNTARPGSDDVWFQRIDGEGRAEGEAARLGVSQAGLHAVAFTGTRFVAVYDSARVNGMGFSGLVLQRFDTDGVADGAPIELDTTFDVGHVALAWSNGGSGMVVYTRGTPVAGSAGLYARPLSPDGAPEGPAVQISTDSVQAPSVVFGDGTWGVAWLARGSARPNDLLFNVLDERGRPALASPRRVENAGAQGQVHVAFGNSTYGVGWSKVDELGVLSLQLGLYDLAGDPLGTAPVPGPTGFGAVTGVSWLTPSFFGVAWQDSGPGDRSTVGVTRVSPTGQASTPVALAVIEGAPATGLSVAGTISKAGAFYTRDLAPQAVGFSPEVRVESTLFAPCN